LSRAGDKQIKFEANGSINPQEYSDSKIGITRLDINISGDGLLGSRHKNHYKFSKIWYSFR